MSSAVDVVKDASTRISQKIQTQQIFISYSRAQFYFAESLAHALQANNFRVWFDSQQLAAGADWEAKILHGLKECDVLLLVASKHSMESALVQGEWTAALARGKKIIVALFEYVELPPELGEAVIVDFRRSFDAAMTHLQTILPSKVVPQEKPRLNPRRIVSRPVRVVEWALITPIWVSVIIGGLEALNFANNGFDGFKFLATFVPMVFFCGFVVRRQRAFVQRTFRRNQTQTALGVAGIILPMASLKMGASFPDAIGVPMVIILFACFCLAVWASWLLQSNPALFRWLPTGEARAWERNKHAGLRSNLDVVRSPTQTTHPTFYIRFTPGDQYVTRVVEKVFRRAGWIQAPEQGTPDLELLLVSAETDLGQASSINSSGRPPLIIVTSNGVQEDVLGALARFQWVDFRRRRRSDVRRVANYLRDPSPEHRTIELNAVPERLAHPASPLHLQILLPIIYSSCLVFLMATIGLPAFYIFWPFFKAIYAHFAQLPSTEVTPNMQQDLQTMSEIISVIEHAFPVNASPIFIAGLVLMFMLIVASLVWLSNGLIGQYLSRRFTLGLAWCLLLLMVITSGGDDPLLDPSLAWTHLLFQYVGLFAVPCIMGEFYYAWLPAPERSFQERAMKALTALDGWRGMSRTAFLIACFMSGIIWLINE